MNRTGSRYSRVPPAETTDMLATQVGVARRGQQVLAGGEDLVGLRQPTGARVDTREPSDSGIKHHVATLAQRPHIGLGGGVLPHLGVHGRREHDRARATREASW